MRVTTDKALSFSTSALITIHVGKDAHKQSFTAHSSILSARSPFFRNALHEPWTEHRDRTITLPEDNPAVFSVYLTLAYTGHVATSNPPSTQDTPSSTDAEFETLAALYVLGEKLCDVRAKNAAVEAILGASAFGGYTAEAPCFPSWRAVRIMYEGTPEGSRGRRLMVDMWALGRDGDVAAMAGLLPKQFFAELSVALLAGGGRARNSAVVDGKPGPYLEGWEE